MLSGDRTLVYRGHVDDQYHFAGEANHVTHNDLENAIEAVLAGKPVAVAETTVDGCLITKSSATGQNRRDLPQGHRAPVAEALRGLPSAGDGGPLLTVVLRGCEEAGAGDGRGGRATRRCRPGTRAPAHDDFMNHRGMSSDESDTIVSWVQAGMPPGRTGPDATPDSTAQGRGRRLVDRQARPDPQVQAARASRRKDSWPIATSRSTYVFPHDTWIDRIQILPDNPKVVHHCNLIFIPTFGDKVKNAIFVTGKVPGGIPMVLRGRNRHARCRRSTSRCCRSTSRRTATRRSAGFRSASAIRAKKFRRSCTSSGFPTTALPSLPAIRTTSHRDLADQARHRRRRTLHAHARPRDRHDLPGPLPGRQDRDAAGRAQLQLRLANRLQPGPTDAGSSPRGRSSRSSLTTTIRRSIRSIPIPKRRSEKGIRRPRR